MGKCEQNKWLSRGVLCRPAALQVLFLNSVFEKMETPDG